MNKVKIYVMLYSPLFYPDYCLLMGDVINLCVCM